MAIATAATLCRIALTRPLPLLFTYSLGVMLRSLEGGP
jgi:hypothetical protein